MVLRISNKCQAQQQALAVVCNLLTLHYEKCSDNFVKIIFLIMTNRLFSIFIFLIFVFSSCQSQTTSKQNIDTSQSTQPVINQEPNYNYAVDVPDDWTIRDTTMQDGLRIRFLLPPQSL
jgi:hypothetical protein